MSGCFAALQVAYARHGIATYPLGADKRPAVKRFNRLGVVASAQLALRFRDADAGGFVAGARNRLTIVDIDSADDRLVVEMQARFGSTPLQVVTPSGGRHLYYRHRGEVRRVKPLVDVDILGAGPVVAAGSIVAKGRYAIERGSLDDLASLPPLRSDAAARPLGRSHASTAVAEGCRNSTLWRRCMVEARTSSTVEELEARAQILNEALCSPPLPHDELVKTVTSAWRYQIEGRNWVGRETSVFITFDEIDKLMPNPDAVVLLLKLRAEHLGMRDRFALSPAAMAKARFIPGWNERRFRLARDCLVEAGRLIVLHAGGAGRGDPSLFSLTAERRGQFQPYNTNRHLPLPPGGRHA
jgi:hypothetical protein